MSNLSLKDNLDNLRDTIEIKQKLWENVIINFTEGYKIAKNNHEANLPQKHADGESVQLAFAMITSGALKFLPGGIGILVMPLEESVKKLGKYLDSLPEIPEIKQSAVNISGETYFNRLKSTLNSVTTNLLEYIRIQRYKLDETGDITITQKEKETVDNLIKMAPYLYPPRDLSHWNSNLQNEIGLEFEKEFWAEYTKKIGAKKAIGAAHSYDVSKMLLRLQKLGVIKLKNKYYEHENYRKNPLSNITINAFEFETLIELADWGKNYFPAKRFGGQLPPAVNLYLASAQVKQILQTSGLIKYLKVFQ